MPSPATAQPSTAATTGTTGSTVAPASSTPTPTSAVPTRSRTARDGAWSRPWNQDPADQVSAAPVSTNPAAVGDSSRSRESSSGRNVSAPRNAPEISPRTRTTVGRPGRARSVPAGSSRGPAPITATSATAPSTAATGPESWPAWCSPAAPNAAATAHSTRRHRLLDGAVDPVRAAAAAAQARLHQQGRRHGQRRGEQEDPAPADLLDEQPGQRRPGDRGQQPGRGEGGEDPWSQRRRHHPAHHHVQRHREQPAAQPLHRPAGGQHRHRRGQAGDQQPEHEGGHPDPHGRGRAAGVAPHPGQHHPDHAGGQRQPEGQRVAGHAVQRGGRGRHRGGHRHGLERAQRDQGHRAHGQRAQRAARAGSGTWARRRCRSATVMAATLQPEPGSRSTGCGRLTPRVHRAGRLAGHRAVLDGSMMGIPPLLDELRACVADAGQVTDNELARHARAHDASHFLLTAQRGGQPARRPPRWPGCCELSAAPGGAADVPLRRHQPLRPGRHRRHPGRHPAALPGRRDPRRRRAGARAARRHGPPAQRPAGPYGRKFGPDPASEAACTIGGVVANNSSGMACGTVREQLPHAGVDGRWCCRPGTVLDTGAPRRRRAAARARARALQGAAAAARPGAAPTRRSVATIEQQFSMKNTMGYGLNALLDHDTPVEILTHLSSAARARSAFVAGRSFRTVPLRTHGPPRLLVFDDLYAANAALPDAGAPPAPRRSSCWTPRRCGSRSLPGLPAGDRPGSRSTSQAALLVEYQATTAEELADLAAAAGATLDDLPTAGTGRADRRTPALRGRAVEAAQGPLRLGRRARPSGHDRAARGRRRPGAGAGCRPASS